MRLLFRPSRGPTAGEYSVLTIAVALFLLLPGAVAVVMGLRAPVEKAEMAAEAVRYGSIAVGLGVLILVARWGIRAWIDAD
jgi:hypothetical protein